MKESMGSQELTKLLIPELKIIKKAAKVKNIPLKDPGKDGYKFPSEDFGSYELDEGFLDTLGQFGFYWHKSRPDGVITLIDIKNDRSRRGDSNYWNFHKNKTPHTLSVASAFYTDKKARGVGVLPVGGGGSWVCGALNEETIKSVVRAMVSHFKGSIHTTLKEMVDSDFNLVMPWEKLGFGGGLRTLSDLWIEFCGRNNENLRKFKSAFECFDPDPEKSPNHYLPEKFHSDLFRLWKSQLENYKMAISV